MGGNNVTGVVSLGCNSATLSMHAALLSTSTTSPGAGVARLELTLKSSDVAILAASHECMSWRLQEWQRKLSGMVCAMHQVSVLRTLLEYSAVVDAHHAWRQIVVRHEQLCGMQSPDKSEAGREDALKRAQTELHQLQRIAAALQVRM